MPKNLPHHWIDDATWSGYQSIGATMSRMYMSKQWSIPGCDTRYGCVEKLIKWISFHRFQESMGFAVNLEGRRHFHRLRRQPRPVLIAQECRVRAHGAQSFCALTSIPSSVIVQEACISLVLKKTIENVPGL